MAVWLLSKGDGVRMRSVGDALEFLKFIFLSFSVSLIFIQILPI